MADQEFPNSINKIPLRYRLLIALVLLCLMQAMCSYSCRSFFKGHDNPDGAAINNPEIDPLEKLVNEPVIAPAKALSFSNMAVTTDTRTGLFGARYVSFEVTGSVTNNTGVPVNADNFPQITWDNRSVSVEMSQDKLLPGETCNVSWEKTISVSDNSIPVMTFSGPFEFVGLDGCERDLNSQLQAIAGDFAAEDAKKEAERKARQQAQEEAKQKKEDEKAALNSCVGLTAAEAYELAKGTQYPPVFIDSIGVDVTDYVTEGADAASARVTKVSIVDDGWLSSAKVTFTLDYINPAEQKRLADTEALNACKGKTAGEAYSVASNTDYEPVFVDAFDINVTEDVASGGEAASAEVTSVVVVDRNRRVNAGVTFTLDYVDPTAKAERDRIAAEEEAARKKAAEEEAARKKAAEEEAARKKAAEEEAARKKAEPSKYEYAYVRRMSNYDLYYLIDLDDMTVTYFGTQSSPMVLPCTGDLEHGLTVDYVNDGFQEHLQFKTPGNDSVVILTDGTGYEWEYKKVSVAEAEAVLARVS